MGIRVYGTAAQGHPRLLLDLGDDQLADDLEALPDEERALLERELLADARIAVGLSRMLRNRRMRERGPLADD